MATESNIMNINDWFYLPIKECQFENTKVYVDNGITYIGNTDNAYWMSNGPYCHYGIQGQRGKYYAAEGKVLCCLGLGLMPLLIAQKPEVTEVVAIEIDINIIKAFEYQDYDMSKITLLNVDMMDIDNVDSFDSILLDVQPTQYEFYEKHKNLLTNKKVVLQGWENKFTEWLSYNKKGVYSYENYLEYSRLNNMPKYSEELVLSFVFDYYAGYHNKVLLDGYPDNWFEAIKNINIPIDKNIVNGLRKVQELRK